jgi:hypothetical protein
MSSRSVPHEVSDRKSVNDKGLTPVLGADSPSDNISSPGPRAYGTTGGIALCQVAVTLTYASGRGHALIGRVLFLPGGRVADEEHRELVSVPEEVMFATKPSWPASAGPPTLPGSAPPSWPTTRYTAATLPRCRCSRQQDASSD